MRNLALALIGGLGLATFAGCMDSLANQPKKTGSIIGKTTDDIKEFDPKAKQEVSDSKVRVDDPVLYAMQAYGPMIEQISKLHIEHAIDLFYASEGRYPKDYNEFMSRIIKANQIRLPVLPGGAKYSYDVENHKLQVVRDLAAAPNGAEPNKAAGAANKPTADE